MAKYIAYHCGKMNQGFAMRDEKNELVYEANLVKFHLFSASDFEFVNKKTQKTKAHKVGKTKTTENHVMGLSLGASSYFKLDGENVFELLEKKGYSFKIIAKLDILHPEFGLIGKDGEMVATLKMNVLGEKQEGVRALGNKQRNTVIETECDDLDVVFLAAFTLNHVDFSTYLL